MKKIMFLFVGVMLLFSIYQVTAKTDSEKLDDIILDNKKLNEQLSKLVSTNDRGTIEVHGTEYEPNADAKIWLILLNSTGDAVINGACQVDIYTPANEEFIENGAMTNMEHDGIYYYDLIAPQAQGVYPAIAKCYYDITETSENADGFTLNTGTVDDKDYLSTYLLDGDEHKLKETNGLLDFEYNFDSMCGINIDELFLTGVSITTNVKWKDTVTNDDITIYFYNYTSTTWQSLKNKIIVPNDRTTVSNFIETNNVTRDGLVSPTGTMELRFNDTIQTLGETEKIEVDWIDISCVEYSDPVWTEVKGSSEMHITSDNFWVINKDSILGNVTNETYLGYMYLNMIVSSQTSTLKENQRVNFQTPVPFPCHHILNVSVEGVDTNWTGVDSGTEACDVNWDMDLEPHTNYEVQIKSENWWKVEIRAWENELDLINGYISSMCNFYAVENGYPAYVIPKEEELNDSFDDFYKSCSVVLDYYDHLNTSINDEYKFDEAVLDYDNMQLLDANWRHLIITLDQYNSQVQNILSSVGLASDMSVVALASGQAPSYFDYWSNKSTSWEIYKQTNTSLVVNSFWEYDGTISDNILTQIAVKIWNYVGRYTHGVVLG